MPTFTSGNDSFTVHTVGTFDLDLLAGDDTLTVDGGSSTTAHMGDGNDLIRLLSGLASVFGDAGADKFDIWAVNATVDGGADNDTINIRGGTGTDALGGLGDDRFNFFINTSGITLDGGDGNDVFYGYNHLISGSILGGLGTDYFVKFITGTILQGGLGNDIYRATVGGAATFVESAGEGTDAVQVARGSTYTLPDNIENISVQGFSGSLTTAATLTGNALNNAIIGHNNDETINGLDGNDRISAQGGNDTVHGGNGNDLLVGGTGTDSLFGEAGNDTLRGAGTAAMSGGAGDDLYYVDSVDDVVTEVSGQGTDTVRAFINYILPDNIENGVLQNIGVGLSLTGNLLDNVLTGNKFADHLTGDDGNDTLRGGLGNDFLKGDNGNDFLDGGVGGDTMAGGAGDDVYVVDAIGDSISEDFSAGTDTVRSYRSDYTLAPEVENGIILLTDGAQLTGTIRANELTGGVGDDQLYGLGGDDVIDGGPGADYMDGGSGSNIYYIDNAGDVTTGSGGAYVALTSYTIIGGLDWATLLVAGELIGDSARNVLTGSDGADQLSGADGDDELYGLDGDDFLQGGSGDDRLDGGSGDDVMHGGDGNDTYYVDSAGDVVDESDTTDFGLDSVLESLASYTLPFLVNNGTILLDTGATLIGNAGPNGLSGGGGNDTLTAGAGNDVLFGNGGDDTLSGEDGADFLRGGGGADSLRGGAGPDTFSYSAVSDSAAGAFDSIQDFTSSSSKLTDDDTLDLSLIDANAAVAGDQAFIYIGLNGFTHTAGELRVTVTTGKGTAYHFYGDTNGDGVADFELLVHVASGTTLYSDDIVF